MSLWLSPDCVTRYLTDSIVLRYNKQDIARIEYNNRAMITNIYVDPPYRQQGLARYLVTLVERRTGLIATAMPPVSELGRFLFS